MKKYDFILFEHSLAYNHQKDLEVIAKLLMRQGLKVAIADIYYEREFCKDSTIPHYHFANPFNYKFVAKSSTTWRIIRILRNFYLTYKYHRFLERALKELSYQTSKIYVGSFFNYDNYRWLKGAAPDVDIFLWGLRSFWFYEYKLNPLSIEGFYSFLNRNLLNKYKNINLFVSNEIIKDEFVALGVSEERLVIRPERVTRQIVKASDRQDNNLRLLTIGSIRRDKRVEMTVEAVKKIKNIDLSFIIAGATNDTEYEQLIQTTMDGDNRIKRINHRLTNHEFTELIDNTDFLVLCDKEHPSCITNGTMDESLLSGKPIIAPNYNPYKHVVEKYSVGILFDPKEIDSLVSAILKAKDNGVSSYMRGIESFQNSLLEERVSEQLVCQLKCK